MKTIRGVKRLVQKLGSHGGNDGKPDPDRRPWGEMSGEHPEWRGSEMFSKPPWGKNEVSNPGCDSGKRKGEKKLQVNYVNFLKHVYFYFKISKIFLGQSSPKMS